MSRFAYLIVLVCCSTFIVFGQSENTRREGFKDALLKLCGNAYEGTITNAAQGDTMFSGKRLLMHVSVCDSNLVLIPFFVGEDSSRTWVLTFTDEFIQLKHDHRKQDGSEDRVTQYGGKTTNSGSANRQIFPADQQTAELIPAAASNVWWIDLQPDTYFSYNLRRMGSDRLFTVSFDLTKPVEVPGSPWGWGK